jgi:tetratricopeptide (TPR) repeat protein
MNQSIALASADKPEAALAILDEGINRARIENSPEYAARLSRHAGVICDDGLNDLNRAKNYYEAALQYFAGDPYLHMALGEIHQRLGETDLASSYFDACYNLASEEGDSDLLEIVDRKRTANNDVSSL